VAGNVRELDHSVERAVLMAAGPARQADDLGLRAAKDGGGRLEDMSLEDVECFLIKKAMTRYDGNVSQAAKALGLSRSALYRRCNATASSQAELMPMPCIEGTMTVYRQIRH
jgi:DNA-binding NtrC family response regulator